MRRKKAEFINLNRQIIRKMNLSIPSNEHNFHSYIKYKIHFRNISNEIFKEILIKSMLEK